MISRLLHFDEMISIYTKLPISTLKAMKQRFLHIEPVLVEIGGQIDKRGDRREFFRAETLRYE